MTTRIRTRRSQQGMALVTALVFLVIMTVISVTVVQQNTVQERMAGNARDLAIAFEAAETALREAERAVAAGTAPVIPEIAHAQRPDTAAFWRGHFAANTGTTVTTTLDHLAAQPRYFVETLAFTTGAGGGDGVEDASYDAPPTEQQINAFRITAMASGATVDSQVILQVMIVDTE